MDIPLALLLLMAIAGLFPSVNLSLSLPVFWRIVLGEAIFYGLVNGIRQERHLRLFTGMLVLGGAGLALLFLAGTNWSAVRLIRLPIYQYLPTLIRDLEDSEAFNPRVAGMALVTLLPVPLSLSLFGQNGKIRLLSGAAVVIMGLTLLLTQSLQGALGLATVLLFLGIWRSRWFMICIPLGLAALGWGAVTYGPQRITEVLLSANNPIGVGVVLRLDMWSRALAMIRDMPYTGIGLNTFPLIQTHFYPGFLLGPEGHSHNLLLQIALDLGLPGLVAFLWLLASFGLTVTRAYRQCSDQDLRALLLGLTAGVLAFFASGVIDTIWTAKPVVILWGLLGMAAAILRCGNRENSGQQENSLHFSPPLPRAPRFRAVPLLFCHSVPLAIALLLALVWFIATVHPAAPYLNLGAVRAHKLLWIARTTGSAPDNLLQKATEPLHQALFRDPDNAHIYGLLGSLYAWEGNYPASFDALEHRVTLDSRDPIGYYAPFEALRRRIQRERGYDCWDDTLRVYSQWMARFPDRAETYVLVAIVWDQHKEDRARAIAVLRSGLEHGAQPGGLLSWYLSRVGQSR
jgi:putative inorganic carbon (HCO3(-)) transporter